MVRRLVDLPEETWKRLKTEAVEEGVTLKQLIETKVTYEPISSAIDARAVEAIRPGEPTNVWESPHVVRPTVARTAQARRDEVLRGITKTKK